MSASAAWSYDEDPPAPPRRSVPVAATPERDTVREASLEALEHLCSLLGYPPEYARVLERREHACGRAWSITWRR